MAVTFLVASAVPGVAGPVPAPVDDLGSMTLQQLTSIDVTSVSKKDQKLAKVPAAVYVITHEDIQRSGATSIPELLRMAPGLDVARIGSSKWAISSRGSNGLYADKLLVLIDGRSVYDPVFAGVFWDVQDTLLEDIDRIEVIRGPGATVWGANAVNGVINIVTKNAAETQGGLVAAGGGTQERGSGAVCYAGSINRDAHYRVFAKYFDRDALPTTTRPGADGWDVLHGGFRLDWDFPATTA
jgi:iron complex outermembrane receptor protein